MSISPHSEINNKKKPQNTYILGLFFAILVVLIGLAIYVVKGGKIPSISQNLTINYYVELDLEKFRENSKIWLKNEPKRQKLLVLVDKYLKEFIPEPEGIFQGKISLVNVDMPVEGETSASRLQGGETGGILFIADIINSQIAENYLKNLGSITKTQEGINILMLERLILDKNAFYYTFNKNQLIMASGARALNLALDPKKNLKFPQKSLLKAFFSDNDLIKIYAKPEKTNFLKSILDVELDQFWLSAQMRPEKLVITLNNAGQNQVLFDSWLNFLPQDDYLAIFSENLERIIDNQYFSKIKKEWEESYNFKFENDIYLLLENKQSLLLLRPRAANYTLDWEDYDFCLIVSDLRPDSAEISKIEQIIKNIFAKEFPKEEIRVLPDNSTITELVSRPEVFEFQSDDLTNINVKYLQKPGLEFGYAFLDNKTVLSSSIGFLKQVIEQNQNYNVRIQISDCLGEQNIPSDFIYFKSNPEFNNEYGVKSIIITSEKVCVY